MAVMRGMRLEPTGTRTWHLDPEKPCRYSRTFSVPGAAGFMNATLRSNFANPVNLSADSSGVADESMKPLSCACRILRAAIVLVAITFGESAASKSAAN
eukprot:4228661-Prymnesium_polylepis.1